MSRYIDADKLIAEIERRRNILKPHGGQGFILTKVLKDHYDDLLSFIDSLQQDQPFPRWIHANYSDKPEIRHSPSGEPYLQSGPYMIWLSDLETLPKDGTDLTNPGPEQPEVDLEKEVIRYKVPFSDERELLNEETLDAIARHFYELGRLNARKEE